ncbi:hypothetical protein ACH4FX_03145 [Streptomyces sp. NPDC018019]|uniref:hypothetical protein n=1 Tax=Streptomyces sp. NPDC018019 TaxID=3365030 RepID=UPI0037BD149D
MKCAHWIGANKRFCRIPGARRYLPGYRCPLHTPAALNGRPEPSAPPRPAPAQP